MDIWSGPWPWIIIALIFVVLVIRAAVIGKRIRKKRGGKD